MQEELYNDNETDAVDINTYFKSSDYCNATEIKFSLGDINPNDGEYDDYADVIVE